MGELLEELWALSSDQQARSLEWSLDGVLGNPYSEPSVAASGIGPETI